MDDGMKVIGLTGSVGSGKSTVANVFKEKFHAFVIFTDDVAKELMKKGQISYQLTVDYFGSDILDEEGEIDRKKLASIVFQDADELKKLNSFSHPYVERYVQDTIKQIKQSGEYEYVVVETALLLEAGYQRFCDEVWFVTVNDEIRRKRLKESRGYDDAKIDSILKNQMSDMTFQSVATHILNNDCGIDKIEQKIQVILEKSRMV